MMEIKPPSLPSSMLVNVLNNQQSKEEEGDWLANYHGVILPPWLTPTIHVLSLIVKLEKEPTIISYS